MSAAKRYPLAILRMARERRMENWAYRRIAVIESHTNSAVAYAGTKASTRPRWTPLSGPKVIKPKTINMGRPGPELFFLSVVTNMFAHQAEMAYLVTNALAGEALRIPILYNGSTVVSNLLVKEPLY